MDQNKFWVKLTIRYNEIDPDIVNAWLNFYGVDAIVSGDNFIEAYVENDTVDELVSGLQSRLDIKDGDISRNNVENKNWNSVWESNFQPLKIGSLYVRAPFHDASNEEYDELIIQPQMAFGTGHHETTYMMLEYINDIDCSGLDILDYGTGTGILAIRAIQKNCKSMTAIDIQPESIENTKDNLILNGLDENSAQLICGDLNALQYSSFDLILANINRHILLQNAAKLFELLKEGASLVCSGILKTDEQLILDSFNYAGFHHSLTKSKGNWLLMTFDK